MFSAAENDGLNDWVSESGSLDTPPESPDSSYADSLISSPPSSASSTQSLSPLPSWSPLSEESDYYDPDAFKLRPAFDSPDSLSKRPLPALNDDDVGRAARRRQRIRHKDPYPSALLRSPRSQGAPHADQFDPSQLFVKPESPVGGYCPFHYRYPSLSPKIKVEPLGLGLDLVSDDAGSSGSSSDDDDGAASSSVDLDSDVTDPGSPSSPSLEPKIEPTEEALASIGGHGSDTATASAGAAERDSDDGVIARVRARLQGRKSLCLSPAPTTSTSTPTSTPPPAEGPVVRMIPCIQTKDLPPEIQRYSPLPTPPLVLRGDPHTLAPAPAPDPELDVDMRSVPDEDDSDDDSVKAQPESLSLANFFDFDLASQEVEPPPSSDADTSPVLAFTLEPTDSTLDVLALDLTPGFAGFDTVSKGAGDDWYPSLGMAELSSPWRITREPFEETDAVYLDPRVLSDSDVDSSGCDHDDAQPRRRDQRRSRRKNPYPSSSPRSRTSSPPTDTPGSSRESSPEPSSPATGNQAFPPSAFGGDRTGDFLRQKLGLPAGSPVNLWALPDRYDPEDKTVTLPLLASIAIYSSEEQGLELSGLREAFKKRFSYFRDEANDKWPQSIRHMLSLQECFVKKKDVLTARGIWTYDYTKDGKLTRARKRRPYSK